MNKECLIICLFVLISGIKLAGQNRGDFLVKNSFYLLSNQLIKPITSEIRLLNHPHGYSSIEYNEPKLSFKYDLSISFFIFKNIGFSVIGGYQNHRFLQYGKSYGRLSENIIQEYKFQTIGIGPVYHVSLNKKFDTTIKYSISYLKHTNNGDTYFLPLNTNQFQHSLMLGFNYNVNSFLRIGTEFISAIATENMVWEEIKEKVEFMPLTLGGGLVVGIRL